MEQVARDGRADRRTITVASGRYRMLTVKGGDEVVQATASLFQQHQERERILGALGLAGGVGLVLATLLAAVLARRAVRPMSQALELQRRFVADAGHELRTPLTLLNTRAQLLSERVHASGSANSQDELVIRDADGIVADTRALTEVLEELLLAADTRTPLPREPVDLGAIVNAAASSAQATADAAAISLTVKVLGPAVLEAGAPTALSRSVTALVVNALDHARTQVKVEVRPAGRNVVVEVTDDGPGIPADVLPRMFARFTAKMIVSFLQAKNEMRVGIINVATMLRGGQGIDDIIKLIKSTVEPDSWDTSGGNGTITVQPPGSLIIKNSAEVIYQLEQSPNKKS